MPSAVEVILKWSDFSKNVSESWMSKEENSAFCDITLVSEDGQNINAHKIILANSSSVLRSIMLESKYPVPLIYLKGVKFDELVSVLDFIYKGETTITQDLLQQFLQFAKELNLKGLNEEVELENYPKLPLNADCSIVKINSEMFDVIGDNELRSEFVKPETVEVPKDQYPISNITKPIENKLFTCNIPQVDLNYQVLSMIKKQQWNEAPEEKNGRKRRHYKCKVCDFLSRSKFSSMNHVEIHINELRYSCTICKHITKTKLNMKIHLAEHESNNQVSDMQNISDSEYFGKAKYGNELEQFICNMNESEVEYQALLMVEKLEEKSRTHGNLYKCNVCNKVSRGKSDCIRHVEGHIDGLSYSCLLCNHTTNRKCTIKVHILKHDGIDNRKVRDIFDITSLASIDKGTLEEQISLRTEKNVEYVNGKPQVEKWTCTVCGKVSLRRIHSVSHVETHIEGLSYSCSHSDCSYSSKTRGAIRTHLSIGH